VGANANYFGKISIDINPDRRTETAVGGMVTTDEQLPLLLGQQKLPDGYTVDVFGGKSWRVGSNQYIRLNLSISNLLNNKNLTVIAFEQLRYQSNDIDRFPPKYAYMYGTNFFLNLNFSF
jgi:hypothetical protein